ncbi:MAG TPA: hypothetical protein VGG83_27405 [Trebonia sp.]|jgi:hypothetical protein
MYFLFAKLVEGGFTPDNALMAFNMAGVYTRGSIITDRILRMANAPTTDPARRRRMTDWPHIPMPGSLVDRYPLAGTSDEDFEFGPDRLVSEFEQLLREQAGRPRKTPCGSSPSRGSTTARVSPARRSR